MAESQQIARIDRGAHARSPFYPVTLSPPHLVRLVLLVLFFGPLIAPLFQATHLPVVADSGALARDMLSLYVCPTPAKSYILFGFPMAVCARCWGATIGLWAAWLVLRGQGTGDRRWGGVGRRLVHSYRALVWPLRLLLSATPFLLWVAEIGWWPSAPYWLVLLNGAFAGLWAGLFFCSIWPGLLRSYPPQIRNQ